MTGYGGATQVATQGSATRGERSLIVRMDANVGTGLPWSFEPELPSIKLRTGETATIFYKVKNKSDYETIGIASYNVAPERAGMFFNKISCFCFSEQRLGPGETMDMPVVFFLDPALEKDEIMKHQDQVTLSYTFYASKTPVTASRSKSAF
jgi:cytochrome c oxidase assembly protein subunit 11